MLQDICVLGSCSGQYIPLCDEDGYYKPTQCHGTAGQCWCVDRYGNEVTGSRTHGAADCGKSPKSPFFPLKLCANSSITIANLEDF